MLRNFIEVIIDIERYNRPSNATIEIHNEQQYLSTYLPISPLEKYQCVLKVIGYTRNHVLYLIS